MKEIYRLQLDDYSAASFTSFGKDYFGTFDQMRELFNAIRCNEDFVSQSSDILTTFDRYLAGEKKITHYLDSKTGNTGYNNYTKYARDLYIAWYYNGNKNGFAWCDSFVDWCFYKAYGASEGQRIECQTGNLGAGCSYSAQYYKAQGRYDKTPKVGDQIFFLDSAGVINHTGLVYAVDSTTVYTVEGNTSGASGVVAGSAKNPTAGAMGGSQDTDIRSTLRIPRQKIRPWLAQGQQGLVVCRYGKQLLQEPVGEDRR